MILINNYDGISSLTVPFGACLHCNVFRKNHGPSLV